MLVLTRKPGESIVIGAGPGLEPLCVITIQELRGNKVRLSFQADHGIPIHRSEVWDTIMAQEEAEAAHSF